MARVASAGGFFLVRLPWSAVTFRDAGDRPFDLFGFLRSIPETEARESTVSFVASDNSVVKCRLIALRKSAVSAEASRKTVLADRRRKGRSIDPRSLEAAEYIILLTNLEADELSSYQALEIYRLRWQIEITFKRFKSLLNLDHLAAREPRMVQTYVLAKILGALLVEDLTDRYLSFFPWGYPVRSTSDFSLAALQNGP
jgi:IS4 transposase